MQTKEPDLVFFPFMHPDLAPQELLEGIFFMDPGIVQPADPNAARYFRPKNLVYEDALARVFLEDTLQFGGQFKHATDAAYFQAASMDNFFSGSMQDIKSEILSPEDKSVQKKNRTTTDAQLVLLLGYYLEEQMLQATSLGAQIDTSVHAFEQSLGLDEDDQSPFDSALSGPAAKPEFAADWRRLIAPYLRFLPESTCLLLTDQKIVEELVQGGMRLTPADDEAREVLLSGCSLSSAPACTKDSVTGKDLADWAGIKIDSELGNKVFTLVTLTL